MTGLMHRPAADTDVWRMNPSQRCPWRGGAGLGIAICPTYTLHRDRRMARTRNFKVNCNKWRPWGRSWRCRYTSCSVVVLPRGHWSAAPHCSAAPPAGLSCVTACTVKEMDGNVLLHEVNLFPTNMLRNPPSIPSPHTPNLSLNHTTSPSPSPSSCAPSPQHLLLLSPPCLSLDPFPVAPILSSAPFHYPYSPFAPLHLPCRRLSPLLPLPSTSLRWRGRVISSSNSSCQRSRF
ncbi:hypothetical protein E2C01_032932 [Portunus trituberculatus]|uniref:Uncharacterized protein n=1 Tax=Portunus trituberculatus TaxID=210409 RepID=A0A5B7F1N4_PORTR|nr:hypothetical protein [Portunus trituberculatus]